MTIAQYPRPLQLPLIMALQTLHHAVATWDTPFTEISTDTRTLKPGALFVALQGDNFDGHQYLNIAYQQGASALIVSCELRMIPEIVLTSTTCNVFRVDDTQAAYQMLGGWWRKQLTARIIAVTGSVGKTTTKELIAACLATQAPVLKTQANYNNEIGVPKTLLQLKPEHRFGVIEMGMRGLGEIALLSQIACPDVAVITNVGTAHIGRLGSRAAIAQAKCELLAELPPQAVAVLNYDNPLLLRTAEQVWSGRVVTFGLTGGDIRGQLLDTHTVVVNGMKFTVPLAGKHNASNFLAALAVAQVLDIPWESLQSLKLKLPGGRSRQLQYAADITFLDETYNAGFEAMLAALQLLKQTPGQRHLAVLGTMKELGDHALDLHFKVGEAVRSLALDHLIILADPAEREALCEGAKGIPTITCTSHAEAADALRPLLKPGDRVLFKASRSVGLEQVIERLLQP
ncbi:MAG: UDP-N-acetylmuramoyl-tripeptide--D-alanyl-D-alanine ligase [Cyanobacteria bacterium P01_H01_bin.121]